jgi:hypothetical protein
LYRVGLAFRARPSLFRLDGPPELFCHFAHVSFLLFQPLSTVDRLPFLRCVNRLGVDYFDLNCVADSKPLLIYPSDMLTRGRSEGTQALIIFFVIVRSALALLEEFASLTIALRTAIVADSSCSGTAFLQCLSSEIMFEGYALP